MKKIYSIFVFFLLICMVSCQNEDELGNTAMGYLRLGLEVNTTSISRAEAEAYNPKQLAVQILDANEEVVEETTNFDTEWKGKTFTLPVGTYTIKASSAGFDGKTSGFDKPYYTGSTTVTIENGKTANPSVTCTLANVKVTVEFEQSFKDAFTVAKVTVDDNADNAGISPLDFEMGKTTQSGYFPVTDLKAVVSATNKYNVTNTQTDEITGVKARDHYILQYKVGDAGNGNGNVSITVDESTHTYTYKVTISTFKEPTLTISSVNAWAKLAYLEGKALNVDTSKGTVTFQYRKKNTTDWSTASATLENDIYKATVTGLDPETTYESRLICNYSEDVFEGGVKEFTTEAATELYNGDFDDWYQASGVWYAVAEGDYNDGNAFWDSGNKGASIMKKNPTQPEESNVHTPGGKSAKLDSQFVGVVAPLGAFAAGNLYTGHFVKPIGMSGAEIQFGSAFTARPTALNGFFQYTAGTVDYYGKSTPSDALVQDGGTDMCAIYIALSDANAPYPVNTSEGTFVDFANDPNIIAYGELPIDECVTTSDWKEFKIDLVYRDLTRKPKYIIVVASASKYGDYFTGSSNSLMYLDDFSLSYDGEPKYQKPSVQE